MRTTLPVTDLEHPITDETPIVSKTDRATWQTELASQPRLLPYSYGREIWAMIKDVDGPATRADSSLASGGKI